MQFSRSCRVTRTALFCSRVWGVWCLRGVRGSARLTCMIWTSMQSRRDSDPVSAGDETWRRATETNLATARSRAPVSGAGPRSASDPAYPAQLLGDGPGSKSSRLQSWAISASHLQLTDVRTVSHQLARHTQTPCIPPSPCFPAFPLDALCTFVQSLQGDRARQGHADLCAARASSPVPAPAPCQACGRHWAPHALPPGMQHA